MTVGFPRSAFRLLLLLGIALFALSGCGLLYGPRQAPISEAEVTAIEPASEPVATPPPEIEEPEEPARHAPKKPKPAPVRTHKPEPEPKPAPPPPPPKPAPLVVTRTIDRSSAHGLLDSRVQRPDGKVLGRAVDVILDNGGKPRQMVVNLQGFMGVGDRKVVFPWTAFHFEPASKTTPVTLGPGPTPAPKPANDPEPSASTLPLLDSTVERANGGKVGRVVDVLIDGNAQPLAVVLDVSGIISADRRTIAANWSALHLVTKDKALHPQVELSDAQIKASPSYETDKPIQAVSPAPPASAQHAAAAAPASGAAAAPAATSAAAGSAPPGAAAHASSAKAAR